MDEHDDTSRKTSAGAGEGATAGRELLLLYRSGRAFAVYGEEAEAVAEGRRPAPLPDAPRAVLGVVPLRGRMRTVLDPAAIDAPPAEPEDAPRNSETPALVVALRGDEQLALACERAERVEAPPAPDTPAADAPHAAEAAHVRAAFRLGPLSVTLLDPAHLFEAAMRGTDRRRHRLKGRDS
jgi:chemotaxis signal transduction protein